MILITNSFGYHWLPKNKTKQKKQMFLKVLSPKKPKKVMQLLSDMRVNNDRIFSFIWTIQYNLNIAI